MSNNTRCSKEKDLLPPSDPTQLEHKIRKAKRATSIDTTSSLIDTTRSQAMINTLPEELVDTNPQDINLVVPLILTRDEHGDLRDQEVTCLMQQVEG